MTEMNYLHNTIINVAIVFFNIGACIIHGFVWVSVPFAVMVIFMVLLILWQTNNINQKCLLEEPKVKCFAHKSGKNIIVAGVEDPKNQRPIIVVAGRDDHRIIATDGKKAWIVRHIDGDLYQIAMAIGYIPHKLKATLKEACVEV